MQTLYPASDHNPSGAGPDRILPALRGATGGVRFSFRYALLSKTGALITRSLPGVIGCTIEQNWLADIKRTCSIRLRDTQSIDYLSDRIQPWVRLHLPPFGELDWCEWPQGVFLIESPNRRSDRAGTVTRDIRGRDLLQQFASDGVTTRYVVTAGTSYTNTIANLLGSVPKSITPSAATLPAAKDWDPGTSKLRIINDLLGAINYESLSFDEFGVAQCRPYVQPGDRAVEYTYGDNPGDGLMVPEADQLVDLFNIPNRWSITVSEPDREPISSTFTNDNPESITSTVRRGRVILDHRTEIEAADQATLDAKVARLATEASQVYEAIEFSTALNPLHSGNDLIRLRYAPLSLNARYVSQSWTMDLTAGAPMRHRARRVVQL